MPHYHLFISERKILSEAGISCFDKTFEVKKLFEAFFLIDYISVHYIDAQGLNDPITQYIEGRLGNRRIFWCPSGYGNCFLFSTLHFAKPNSVSIEKLNLL